MLHFVPRYQQRFEIGRTSVVLVREPQNSFDKNAIRVDNVSGIHSEKIEAAILAPWLDDTLVRIDSLLRHEPSCGRLHHVSLAERMGVRVSQGAL